MSLLDLPHHDGSDVDLAERPLRLGDEAVVCLRVPIGTELDAVAVRYLGDGEPRAGGRRARRGDRRETLVARLLPRLQPRRFRTAGSSPAASSATPG